MIKVETFYANNDLRNFSYLLYDQGTGFAWAIDPFESETFIKFIKRNSLHLKGILNTHQHWDHVRGNKDLMETFSAPVQNLGSRQSITLDNTISLEGLDSPGHTMDHKVFLLKEGNSIQGLFSGDTLFNSGVGNCRNGGDVNLLFDTTVNLLHLPESTLLYPGHDYRRRNLEFALSVEPENKSVREELKILPPETFLLPPATLQEEKEVNPFLRLTSRELIENVLPEAGKDERELFIRLRQLRDQW